MFDGCEVSSIAMRKPTCDVCCGAHSVHVCACGFGKCRACARTWTLSALPECAQCHVQWSLATQRRVLGITFVNGPLRAHRRRTLAMHAQTQLADVAAAAHQESLRRRARAAHAALERGEGLDDATIADLARATQRVISAGHWQTLPCAHCSARACAETGTCTACDERTCTRCGAADHVGECDPNVLATNELIRRECRPCAACAAPSVRTEGCPVMWCARCHAFWHWDTREVLHGTPHNPDHRAWAGARQREVGDLPCGGLPSVHSLPLDATTMPALRAVRACTRAQMARVRRFSTAAIDTRRLRIAFLLGDIDDAGLGERLERDERTQHFHRDVSAVLATFVYSGIDILLRLTALVTTPARCTGLHERTVIVAELEALRELTDEALVSVARDHQRVAPRLSREWEWTMPHDRRPTIV